MIDLRSNCVAQYKMNDNADSPWVAGLNGIPTGLGQGGKFSPGDGVHWTWGTGWAHAVVPGQAKFSGAVAGYLEQDIGIVQGQKYLVLFDIDANTSPVQTITPYVGGQAGTGVTSLGYHSEVITAADTSGVLKFKGSGSGGSDTRLDDVFCICLDDFPNTGLLFDGSNNFTSNHSVAGKVSTALSLNGIDDYIDLGTGATLRPDAWSIAAWVKITDDTETNVTLWSWNPLTPIIKLEDSSKPLIKMGAANLRYFASTAWDLIKDGSWHLVIFTCPGAAQADINDAQMYVDNQLITIVSTLAIAGQSAKTRIYIGADAGTARFLEGYLDNVCLFNKVLSQTERDFIWNGGNCTERLWGYDYRASGRGIMRGVMRGVR